VKPVTPEQARAAASLLRSPGAVAIDVVQVSWVVVEAAPGLPAALVHDVVTAPVRHWHLVRGLVTDTVALVAGPRGEAHGVFRNTTRALYRSQMFSAAADALRRVTQPTNRTARLAIVLTARAHGFPAQTGGSRSKSSTRAACVIEIRPAGWAGRSLAPIPTGRVLADRGPVRPGPGTPTTR
jgi:hypothetical protein